MKKVLVVGASGLIGSRFVELTKDKLDIIPVDENTLDITNKDAVFNYFAENVFDSVVNFAAYTNVDGAEKERGNENGLTWKLNVIGVNNLVDACKLKNRFFVQMSTDFVFTGDINNPGPYSENSSIPESIEGIGWYGWSKNRAEKTILESKVKYAIVRIGYPFYSSEYKLKLDYAKNFLKLFDEGKLFPIFTDQIQSILNIDDLIDPLVKILEDELVGTFHVVSSDTVSPYDFVSYLLEKARGVKSIVQKGSMEDFLKVEGRTPRPRLGGLKTEITQDKLGIKFKTWREMVDEFISKL